MGNKEIIKSIMPNAKQESHTTGFPREKYYLIRNGSEFMYLAEGETPAKAWKNALPDVLYRAKRAIELERANNKMLEALQNLENDDGSIPDHAWKLVEEAIESATSK